MSASTTHMGQSLCHCAYKFHLRILSRKMQILMHTIRFFPILATRLQLAITETLWVGRFTSDIPWMSTPDVSNWICLQHNAQTFPQPQLVPNMQHTCSQSVELDAELLLQTQPIPHREQVCLGYKNNHHSKRAYHIHTGFHVQCLLFLFIIIKIKCFDKC
jgi:hypothetical protein